MFQTLRRISLLPAVFAGALGALATPVTPALASGIEITIQGEANGVVRIDLFEEIAPRHAERITTLASQGAYDGVVFHRVIEGFMAQTGDVRYGHVERGNMSRAGQGGSSMSDLPAEFSEKRFQRGTVGMARAQSPNSANSQFFIMFADAPHLNGDYTVVGEVVSGMEVVDAIKRGRGRNGMVSYGADVMVSVKVTD